ncbi:MAG TPA: DoxX family protein [Tepidisphaeraceae bacterium]|nr:DoxX family protein [Tepidisphaeraceae bacterium]
MLKTSSANGFPARFMPMFVEKASHLQSAVLLLLRWTWGFQLLESGYGHLTHVGATLANFQKWGVPMPQANVYISGATELVGGSLLMLGLCTRLISIPLVFNFIVAIVAASRHEIAKAFDSSQSGGLLTGWDTIIDDTAFPMLVLALIMIAFGPGKASIDYLLSRTVCRAEKWKGPPTNAGIEQRDSRSVVD